MIVTLGIVVALAFAAVAQIEAKMRDLTAWGLIVLTVALLYARL